MVGLPSAVLSGLSALTILSIQNDVITDLTPLTGLPITGLFASGCKISDITPVASFPTPGQVDLGFNLIEDLDPLLAADWYVDDDACGLLTLLGNPLSAAALQQVIPTVCTETRVPILAEGAECMGVLTCPGTY